MFEKCGRNPKKLEALFRNMFVKTGVCVLRQPNLENAILALIVRFMILLAKSAKEKYLALQDDITISNYFKISLEAPFFQLDTKKLKSFKQSSDLPLINHG